MRPFCFRSQLPDKTLRVKTARHQKSEALQDSAFHSERPAAALREGSAPWPLATGSNDGANHSRTLPAAGFETGAGQWVLTAC